jgi:hypothetical protein
MSMTCRALVNDSPTVCERRQLCQCYGQDGLTALRLKDGVAGGWESLVERHSSGAAFMSRLSS